MGLNTQDYIDLVESIIQCIQLKEQQEAVRLINEKIDKLSTSVFESNAKIQKVYVIIIGKLKFAHKKMLFKADVVDSIMKDTWCLLAEKINDRIFFFAKTEKND